MYIGLLRRRLPLWFEVSTLILSNVGVGLIVYSENRDPAEWTDPEYIGFE